MAVSREKSPAETVHPVASAKRRIRSLSGARASRSRWITTCAAAHLGCGSRQDDLEQPPPAIVDAGLRRGACDDDAPPLAARFGARGQHCRSVIDLDRFRSRPPDDRPIAIGATPSPSFSRISARSARPGNRSQRRQASRRLRRRTRSGAAAAPLGAVSTASTSGSRSASRSASAMAPDGRSVSRTSVTGRPRARNRAASSDSASVSSPPADSPSSSANSRTRSPPRPKASRAGRAGPRVRSKQRVRREAQRHDLTRRHLALLEDIDLASRLDRVDPADRLIEVRTSSPRSLST